MTAAAIRILVIDDEPIVADTTAMLLCRFGYAAEGMTDPVAALERVRAAPNDVDLILTDQTMPGITGDMLARRINAVRPELPVVIMTGFSYRVSPETAREIGVRAVLYKPVAPNDLHGAIDRALRGATD
jgi:two-component system cell cycle sensor histidine kinase/response regulator CckA